MECHGYVVRPFKPNRLENVLASSHFYLLCRTNLLCRTLLRYNNEITLQKPKGRLGRLDLPASIAFWAGFSCQYLSPRHYPAIASENARQNGTEQPSAAYSWRIVPGGGSVHCVVCPARAWMAKQEGRMRCGKRLRSRSHWRRICRKWGETADLTLGGKRAQTVHTGGNTPKHGAFRGGGPQPSHGRSRQFESAIAHHITSS